ncbi:MAG TPA: hypothetical protein VMW83_05845 [Spirochaetia bacterium]|nr:hypothetical protein [Spirochaetia bacterium]
MVELVKALPDEIQKIISPAVWNVKTVEGIRKKKELGVSNIPSIVLNDEPFCQSFIPPMEDLIQAIRDKFYNG